MCSHQWKHDVFVSFRGKEMRKKFASHLFSGLSQAGIHYYSDEDSDDAGEEIRCKLLRAIRHSRFAVILFSPKYAESKWCLNELVEILECRRQLKNHGHVVVPIFHGVNTSDLSTLTGESEFGQGFKRLCKNVRDDAQKKKWRDALAEAKKLSGFHLENHAHGNESALTEMVVKRLYEKIDQIRSLSFVKNAIGAYHLAGDVISLLRNGQKEDVRMIGICGTEGIGKTMVAGVACDRILDEFECFVSLDKIGEATRSDILGLQKKLLKNLIKVNGMTMYDDIHTNTNDIMRSLCRKKLLLVLNDVTKKEQMDYFGAGERVLFRPGSRILITTRDQNLLKVLEVDEKYTVKGLSRNEALQLFCHHAFKRESKQGYEELCRSLIHYAGGHPLALIKFGSSLSAKSIDQWYKILDKLVRSPYLDCIDGVYSSHPLPLQSVGRYGDRGGSVYDDETYTGVRQISILVNSVKSVIDSITIDHDQDGCLVRSFKRNEYSNGEISTVKLDHPNEYLTAISGHIRDDQTPIVIQSLKFHTNRKIYGPFGLEEGQSFHLPQVNGMRIFGFHGKCGSHLYSIGAHFGPISHKYPFKVVGPFGGDQGTDTWNDEGYTDVREIVVGFDSAIKSISIIYDKYGRPSDRITHGTEGGKLCRIQLDHPSEYLTSISGYTAEVAGLTILQSLTIHTNRSKHGPIGTVNEGRHFSFPYTGGKIVGFHGSCNDSYLESIGAFYDPIPHTYPIKVFGPFGGNYGDFWDDGKYIDIKRIVVRYGLFIHSITFDYVDANTNGSIRSTRHGGNGGENTSEVVLESSDEYITSFSGYFIAKDGHLLINSLTFRTNKRIWGPIGKEEGNYFSLPSEAGKVIGFFGRSGGFLESIGAYVELYSNKLYPFKSVGLFGSSSGSCWDDGKRYTNVKKIIVEFEPSKGPFIRSIMFQYEDENKELWQSETHGGIDDKRFHIVRNIEIHTIEILDQYEYLTSISGYVCGAITSLTFQTNKKTIGPIGDEKGWHFSSPATGGKIVGFYGRSGKHLEAIGAHFKPILDLYPIKSIGPFGGLCGRPWIDGKFNGVRKIEVMHDNIIHCIRFAYDESGKQSWSDMHGSYIGVYPKKDMVELDYPREYLTSISGYVGENGAIIQSLTFYSNRGRHGPFGKEMGKYFWYPSTGSRIIGFYGRCSKILNSIGVYAEPIPHPYPFKISGPFGGFDGTPWDDGVHTDVREFYVIARDAIHSIGIMYDNNGSSVKCSQHGAEDEFSGIQITLDYPKERLISISGKMNGNGNDSLTFIQNLSIHTTKTTYGPYGLIAKPKNKKAREMLTPFRIPSASSGGRIVGFFGRAGSCLNSIGAHLEPY